MPLAMLVLVFLSTFTSPGPSVNGVKIVTRQVTGSFTDTRTEYLAPDRLRNEWQSQMRDHIGPPMATIILRGEHNRIFVLDLQAREYTTYESDARGTTVGIRPKPTVDSGGTLQIWLENIDTGERRDIFGHTARHIITRERRIAGPGACSKPSQSETDGWYIDGAVLPEWPRKSYHHVAQRGHAGRRHAADALFHMGFRSGRVEGRAARTVAFRRAKGLSSRGIPEKLGCASAPAAFRLGMVQRKSPGILPLSPVCR